MFAEQHNLKYLTYETNIEGKSRKLKNVFIANYSVFIIPFQLCCTISIHV